MGRTLFAILFCLTGLCLLAYAVFGEMFIVKLISSFGFLPFFLFGGWLFFEEDSDG